MKIKQLIKTYRNYLNDTQAQFGKRFGVKANTVSRWESGEYQVPNKVLEEVFDKFGVTEVICPFCMGSGMYKKFGYI